MHSNRRTCLLKDRGVILLQQMPGGGPGVGQNHPSWKVDEAPLKPLLNIRIHKYGLPFPIRIETARTQLQLFPVFHPLHTLLQILITFDNFFFYLCGSINLISGCQQISLFLCI